ncbi:hypothetical protein 18India_28 [Salmonella phage 18-India]|nr:hypothetical protein 18India_28 [Salmonella phage 18-India]
MGFIVSARAGTFTTLWKDIDVFSIEFSMCGNHHSTNGGVDMSEHDRTKSEKYYFIASQNSHKSIEP